MSLARQHVKIVPIMRSITDSFKLEIKPKAVRNLANLSSKHTTHYKKELLGNNNNKL